MAKPQYQRAHQQERERWRPVVEAGQARCAEPVCVMPSRAIDPREPWHLSHDPTGKHWIGPSHRRCNLAESNRRRLEKTQRRNWIL